MRKKRRSREFKKNSQVIDIEQARKQRLDRKAEEKRREEERIRYAASQKTRGKMAIRRSRIRRRALIALLVVAITGVVVFSVLSIVSLRNEQKEMKDQLEALEKEKAQLKKELSETNDPANLEEQARDQLRLIKNGEYLYIFPDEITKSNNSKEDSVTEEE